MRQVNSTDLSDEQDDILLDAPLKDVVLISGPPGSGKTVMAFHRGEALAEKFNTVNLMMFNKVLRKFSSNATSEKKIKVQTMNAWIWWWWIGVTKRRPPETEQWVLDYDLMFNTLLDKKSSGDLNLDKLNWNHIIIDEAQDFSNKHFTFLNQVRTAFFPDIEPPSVTLLADENQMLFDDNSTLNQIKSSFSVDTDKNLFYLTKNYRNTDQINSFIEYFYVGLETGKTQPSGKKGDKPELIFSNNFSRTIKFITRHAKKFQNHEIGIIVPTNVERKKYYDALDEELIDSKFNVQTYASKSKVHNEDSLDFDKEGTVTVLNRASCKGLEFDAVFIPELSSMNIDDSDLDKFKMNMYVMCSRARTHLTIFVEDQNSSVLNHLPGKQNNILEYKDV